VTQTVVGYYDGSWTTDHRRAVTLRKREVAEAHAARMRDRCPRNADLIKVEELADADEQPVRLSVADRAATAQLPRVLDNRRQEFGTDGREAATGSELDIGAVLNDLYANEINGSIAWIRDRGFRATLEKSRPIENWFHFSGEAVRWLRRQALVLDPQSEFTHPPNQAAADIDAILDDLYTNQISGSISWVWDRGFYATLGAPKQAEDWAFPRIAEAVEWLIEKAIAHCPDSEFAHKYGGFV
jgi:hypothetical protein